MVTLCSVHWVKYNKFKVTKDSFMASKDTMRHFPITLQCPSYNFPSHPLPLLQPNCVIEQTVLTVSQIPLYMGINGIRSEIGWRGVSWGMTDKWQHSRPIRVTLGGDPDRTRELPGDMSCRDRVLVDHQKYLEIVCWLFTEGVWLFKA